MLHHILAFVSSLFPIIHASIHPPDAPWTIKSFVFSSVYSLPSQCKLDMVSNKVNTLFHPDIWWKYVLSRWFYPLFLLYIHMQATAIVTKRIGNNVMINECCRCWYNTSLILVTFSLQYAFGLKDITSKDSKCVCCGALWRSRRSDIIIRRNRRCERGSTKESACI